MSNKKKNPNSLATKLPKLTIGSRVRCTDDGMQGRIVWANAVAVKIRWDDGEQVTWRRDAWDSKPIAILAEGSQDQACSAAATTLSPQTEAKAPPQAPATAEQQWPPAQQAAVQAAAIPAAIEPAPAQPCAPSAAAEATAVAETTALKHTAADSTPTRLSALDAAAKVLGETGQALTCPQLIALMAAKGYWTSPGGKTPQATLCSALLRDIAAKGPNSRFVKSQRGQFARNDAV